MATRTRQRTPLHQLSGSTVSASATTARRTPPLSGTVSVSAATSSNITTSSTHTYATASTTRSAASTVIPAASSASKNRLTKPKGGGLFGSKSNNSTKNAGLGTKKPVSNQESSSSTAKMGSKTDSKAGGISGSSSASNKPFELPLLPVLDDFELSMPFLSEPSSSSSSSSATTSVPPTSSSRSPSSSSSSSLSNSRPLNSATSHSSFSSSSRFLTSQSPRVQNLNPSPRSTLRSQPQTLPSNSISRNSTLRRQTGMNPRVTTIDATGIVHQQSPLDLSSLEVSSDYFIHTKETLEKPSLLKVTTNHARTGSKGDLEQGKAALSRPSAGDDRKRYIIQQPPASKSSGPSSPSPSMASSHISEKDSQRSPLPAGTLHQSQQGSAVDPASPLQQQHPGQKSDASQIEKTAGHAPRTPSKDDDTSPQLASPGSATKPKAQSATKPPTSPVTPAPKKVVALKQPPAGSSQESHNNPAGLRTRLTRLFRPTPKLERLTPQEQRQRDLHKQGSPRRSPTSPRSRPQSPSSRSRPQSPSPRQQRPGGRFSPSPSPQPLSAAPSLPLPLSFQLSLPLLLSEQESGDQEASTLLTQTETSATGQPLPGDHGIDSTDDSSPAAPKKSHRPSVSSAQTAFAPTATPTSVSAPASPLTREDSKARQRRVSSVSSSNSIRQVGSYGNGNTNSSKMISSRKANPYYTGVVARFGNGGKHSLHDKDLSSSSARRRSLVSVGGERSKVGTEAATSRDKLNAPAHTKSSSTDARRPSPTSSSVSSIGADVKDTHGTTAAQRSNQPTVSATPSPAVNPSGRTTTEVGESQKKLDRPNLRIGTPSTDTSWSRATGAATDVGTIPDSASSAVRTDSVISHAMTSYESHDSDSDNDTPSVSTVSSRMVQSYRDQGVVITESWVIEEPQIDINNSRPPTLYIQRPSMDVSILPVQPPFQSMRRMSTASSILSSISNGGRSDGLKRFTQWSEHSHDPSAPLRWDELFEMDPSSRGPLWLSQRGLGQIPHEFFDGLRNLRELYLDHNDIKVVPDSLLKLSKLDVLDLSCNSISSFDTAFKLKKLKNLRRLNLDHNLLTDISPIYKLKSLRELRMNHNFVPYLAAAIHNLTKLKILSMESNSITMLPETMGKLGNLCELRLSGNNLRTLPDSIGAIRTLQVLALRSNLLEKLPESWKDMENLSTLDLACNHLTSLPADIVRLPRLTHLDLHDNQIRALPEKIGQLSNLVVLQLCNNQLHELPKDIGRLRDLHDLVLSFNQLHGLPDEIGKLTKLQELKFNNNPLQSLPKTIQRLTNVRRVYLQGCELRDLPVELGIAFKDLVYLDLSENKFEVMPALDQMNKLEEFYINGNFLREIGTSSLNLQTTTTTPAPNSSGTTPGVSGQANNAGSGSVSVGGQTGGAAASQSGNATGSAQGAGPNGLSSAMASGGLTASKLSELKRLRVFEAQDNQIRVLTPKIKMLPCLEVLNLGNNQLTCLPKEVGDIVDLKVLILEGNQIKSLPSTLTRLMGSLEVFRIGEWPENGFEITRDQPAVNMKINVLQTYLPQQIERTMLMRMHDCILKRVQELDSQQYRDQHDQERSNSIGGGTRITPSHHKASGSTYSLGSGVPGLTEATPKPHYGLTPGLAIAAHNMITNRSFGLSGNDDITRSPLLTVNSEGINQSYVDHPHASIRTLPSLQLSGLRSHSSPITTLPMSTSPQTTTPPTGPMSSFPLLNSLRPRKSQQLSIKNSQGAGARPKTIYGSNSQPSEQEPPSRLSRVFDIGNGSKPKNDGVPRVTTLESSSIDLSTETMLALGLGTQLESVGNVSAHSNGGSRLGDGSLANIKSSMAIKSTPSLSSVPLSLLPPRPSSPAMTGVATSSRTADDRAKGALSRGPGLLRRSSSSIGASTEGQSSEKSTGSAWMRLKSGTVSFGSTQENNYQQQQSDPASGSSSNTSLQQPTVNGQAISAPAPPPIFLDCKFDTPLMAGIPHLYSAGDDDVDGDHPIEGAGMDDETEDDRSSSTTAGGDVPHARNKGKARMADTPDRVSDELYAQWHQSYNQHQSSNLMNATDPVLKIAVLKQIYDQILGSMDTLVEQSVQESPAKKNNRFKLLNTLRFLKADRSANGGLNAVPSGYHPFPAMMQ